MSTVLIDEHYRLRQTLRDIENEDADRRRLIQLCVFKMLTLKSTIEPESKTNTATKTAPAVAAKAAAALPEKLHDYELRISVLKQQLSTKEKVHEAQVDELKERVAYLQTQLDEKEPARAGRPKILSPPLSAGNSRSLLAQSGFGKPTIAHSIFSPLARPNLLKGKGNSFSSSKSPFGLNFASQASLKLSQSESTKTNAYFSSPNTSTSFEQTPSRNPAKLTKLDDHENPAANLTLANMTSEGDETFQTANGSITLVSGKKKKKKIQLLSSEASKVILDLQGKGLHVEDEDLNSLNYYEDENFKDETKHSPVRAKRPLEGGEEPAKKRHVFKI